MSAGAVSLVEFESQIALALRAGKKIAPVAARDPALEDRGQAVWRFAKAYWATLSIVERTVDLGALDQRALQRLYGRLLPLEQMADTVLADASKKHGLSRPSAAAALLSLQACNERMKDWMVAIESMLDPDLDDRMAAALEEHQKGKTVLLDSIS